VSDRVLVVEDEPDVGLAIRTLLLRAGYEVQVASSGQGGVDGFRAGWPDAVVLDVGLPDLDGWQVLDRIRAISTRPVLLLTAHGGDADKVRGLQSGADDYLTKPFSNPELVARVDALIRRSRSIPDDDPATVARVDELRLGIERGEVVPYYQPIVDIHTSRIVGAEALARWLHPVRGLVPPEEFISLAEQADLVGSLGLHMLRRACLDAARWPGTAKVTVNVSGQQLLTDGFHLSVVAALSDAALLPARLVLEVTESTVAGDDPLGREVLEGLRALGVRVAIDDFGTGYSNLSRLATLPVDLLKLDRSFLAGIQSDGRGRSLVRGLVSLAHELGLSTVIEGIEHQAQAATAATLGADEGQGWLWGRAVPNGEFVTLLPT
jgi:EAL domain-containing protein (putative c-di-GMP-specific phosphodiesterase class I)/CheY-like chemotaxis protein